MTNLLAGPSPAPQTQRVDMRAFVTDPRARKQQQLSQMAEQRSAEAWERIREDMEAGRDLRASDIRHLSHDHHVQLYAKGDDYVRQMVEDLRRQRERDSGRQRERGWD